MGRLYCITHVEHVGGTPIPQRGHTLIPKQKSSKLDGSRIRRVIRTAAPDPSLPADWQVDTGGLPHEVKEHTAANLRKQAEESRALLGSHLHLYQVGLCSLSVVSP